MNAMRVGSVKVFAVGLAVAAGALLSACGGGAPTGTASTPPQSPKQETQAGGQPESNLSTEVNCSASGGKVGPYQVDVVAVETPKGIAGCTEAINVIAEYFQKAGKSEGSGRHVEVKGWKCMADTGAKGTGSISCDKDGLSFHTSAVQPSHSGGKTPPPEPEPEPSGPAGAGPAEDVNCSKLFGGKVGPVEGPKVDVIAIGTENGNPGCDMAFKVLNEYFAKAPGGEGPGRRVIDIQGNWSCAKAADPEGSKGVVYCGQEGPGGYNVETAPAE
ncbi:hypothetical protein ALI144C_04600 [Actinosynnema sp. ALI-1.44]|uniref:hypothetical protein n=1 Tax=Actinosynnema sp. ALI-1.44 TaxID=1933779 RepID=UPI00097C4A5A|nr:hypothetical protein [Actinosynnema sp. ALI-1.44]ONI89624.1 hypothetical protein ALI144C_04600 [Actinosynnema sp. ALI-1.44]